MGLDPTFRFNADLDPDMDGYDIDGDGSVTYPQLEVDLTIISIDVDLGELVSANQTVARGQVVYQVVTRKSFLLWHQFEDMSTIFRLL